ncbi:MAG TPA: dihydroorotate dehydrogenase [Caldilineae bacterium]|nr:dihydroorotate dehydrogenase [Caldilineae bacterium]
MSIELAPDHKTGLVLRSPRILAAGMIGYGDARSRALDLSDFGAWVTAPISLRSRSGSPPPRMAEVPGGVVLVETGQNPGVHRVLRDHAMAWSRMGLPVIARLWGSEDEQAAVAEQLDQAECVAALELAPDDREGPEAAARLVSSVRRSCELPLLVILPLVPDVVDWATACAEAGANALVVGQPPRAIGFTGDGVPMRGRLYGPTIAALAWASLEQVARADLGLPLIGAGGIHRPEDARAFLTLGAVAFQIDVAIWIDPTLPKRVMSALEGNGIS